MLKGSDTFVKWVVHWLFVAMHPDADIIPIVDVEFRSNMSTKFTGLAYNKRQHTGRYLIRIERTLPLQEALRVLAHEIRHITQYETGRLKHVKEGWLWNGEKYDKGLNWKERPWEAEAVNAEYLGDEARAAYDASQNALQGPTFLVLSRSCQ